MWFQIALLLFAFFAILKTWRQLKQKEVSKYWAVTFTVFWLFVLLVAAIPDLTGTLARFVGIGRGADMVMYTAIVVLTYTMYRIIVRQQKLSKDLTALVRAVAIENAHVPPQK
jgi:hypothetical protein